MAFEPAIKAVLPKENIQKSMLKFPVSLPQVEGTYNKKTTSKNVEGYFLNKCCILFYLCIYFLPHHAVCGILVADQGLKPCPLPSLESQVLTTGPPGKSLEDYLASMCLSLPNCKLWIIMNLSF